MEVPLVSIIDMPNVAKYGLKNALQFAFQFHQYRNNLSHNSWSCLTSIYPRANYITYYYVLFWWADYCGVKNELIEDPDRSLIAELFFRYIVEIDKLIDKPDGDILLKKPALIKSNPAVEHILKKMCKHIEISPHLSSSIKRSIYQEIWKYRQECLEICQHAAGQTDIGLDTALFFKEKTTGGLFRVWAFILANLYCDDPFHEIVTSSQNILEEATMAMQVLEDMLDFPEDYKARTLNIFYEILKKHPGELIEAEAYLDGNKWHHLDFIWAEQNLPQSYGTIFKLSHGYLQKAMTASSRFKFASKLCKFIGTIPTHPIV